MCNAKCKSTASCTTEERSISSNRQTDTTLKSQCKDKRKKRTAGPTDSCRQRKWTGPFNSPFDLATHRDYLLCNAMEYYQKTEFYTQSCLLVSPKPKYENQAN